MDYETEKAAKVHRGWRTINRKWTRLCRQRRGAEEVTALFHYTDSQFYKFYVQSNCTFIINKMKFSLWFSVLDTGVRGPMIESYFSQNTLLLAIANTVTTVATISISRAIKIINTIITFIII
jgi:hypothetical protein